jgi:signal transduction histidine kinase
VLSASADSRKVYLSIRDTGSGIAPEDLPFIFDRFYRADKSRYRTDSVASGLGLAIAKAIVEAHSGAITVESAPGVGTNFTITLPLAHHQAESGGSDVDAHKRTAVGAQMP